MRILPAAAATVALTFAVATPASGHAELVPWQLPPGATAGLTLLVTHGCGDEDEWISTEPLEEEPTVAVTVQAPLELDIVPGQLEGWTLTSETDATGRVTTARWDSDDPEGTSDTLQIPLDVTVADVPDGSEIWLPVVQDCTGGESLSWTLEGDLRGGDEIPAMRLLINDDATAPPSSVDGEDDGVAEARGSGTRSPSPPAPTDTGPTPRLGLPSLLLATFGVAALGAVLLRRRLARP